MKDFIGIILTVIVILSMVVCIIHIFVAEDVEGMHWILKVSFTSFITGLMGLVRMYVED